MTCDHNQPVRGGGSCGAKGPVAESLRASCCKATVQLVLCGYSTEPVAQTTVDWERAKETLRIVTGRSHTLGCCETCPLQHGVQIPVEEVVPTSDCQNCPPG